MVITTDCRFLSRKTDIIITKAFRAYPTTVTVYSLIFQRMLYRYYDLGTDVCNGKIYDMDLVLYVCNGSFWHLNDIYRNHF